MPKAAGIRLAMAMRNDVHESLESSVARLRVLSCDRDEVVSKLGGWWMEDGGEKAHSSMTWGLMGRRRELGGGSTGLGRRSGDHQTAAAARDNKRGRETKATIRSMCPGA